ncbi:hypothetical protein DM02DRAFT_166858 [Periconia macrospinosa]|uniref:AA1-like domain-containing protein n=1 Tax=Periconia macrospinosa TaxID=97972 RepID=A0A2V1E5K4_9PLEO|nr:hypothetical protein DM02DRAFT_166858 [Periconia macrospinosa]
MFPKTPFSTTLLLLPTLLNATPLPAPSPAQCTPTTYTIASYTYTYKYTYPAGSSASTSAVTISNPSVNINFAGAAFPDPSVISDAAREGVKCEGTGDNLDSFPNEIVCEVPEGSKGGLRFGLRSRVDGAQWQVVHEWGCDGQAWMSSTPISLAPLSCGIKEDAGQGEGIMECVSKSESGSTSKSFVPENVRRVCAGPTCG